MSLTINLLIFNANLSYLKNNLSLNPFSNDVGSINVSLS